jgi:hypothetical protein
MQEVNRNNQVAPKLGAKNQKIFWGKIVSITLGVLGLVVVLAIIGGGAMLAGHVWNPAWNPFKPSPTDTMIKQKYFKK